MEFNTSSHPLPIQSDTQPPARQTGSRSAFATPDPSADVGQTDCFDPVDKMSLWARLSMLSVRAKAGLVCLAVCLCLVIMLTPAAVQAVRDIRAVGMPLAPAGAGRALCRVLISAGLPPTDRPLWALSGDGGTKGDTDTLPLEPESESEAEPGNDTGLHTDPGGNTTAEPGTESESSPEPDSMPGDTSWGTSEGTSSGGAERESETAHELETDAEQKTGPESETETTTPSSKVSIRDMSESQRGPTYIWNETVRDPASVPAEWNWSGTGTPTVLIVTSHPYETYADGEGTVSDLAVSLAADLRARGVSVIHINRAWSGLEPDDSLQEAYTRTQALVRYTCRLYSDICLVMDLRRSAESAGEGVLLGTAGHIGGQDCAQLRLIADALRDGSGDRDLTFALALRQRLFAVSPTVSRPVWWRAGQGLVPAQVCAGSGDGPVLLTVELGAAGDTYRRAEVLVPVLGEALADILRTE